MSGTTNDSERADPAQGRVAASGPRWQCRHTLIVLALGVTLLAYLDRIGMSVASAWMAGEYGWSQSVQGLVLASFFIGYLLTQIPGGWLSGRFEGKGVLAIAVLWWFWGLGSRV